jgi:hypothetical protein
LELETIRKQMDRLQRENEELKRASRAGAVTGGFDDFTSNSHAPPTTATKRSKTLDIEETPFVANVSTVMCSGLEDDLRSRVLSIVEELGVTGYSGSSFSKKVSHVVSSGAKSSKILAAALCGSWVVNVDWILDSEANGAFLSETAYGRKYNRAASPVYRKKLHITKEFADAALKKMDEIDMSLKSIEGLLYSLGSAEKCSTMAQADVILTTTSHKKRLKPSKKKCYNWEEFQAVLLKK